MRNQLPERTLFQDYPRDIPLVTEFGALLNHDYLIAFTGLVGLSIEVLVIMLAAVPFSSGITLRAALIACWTSVGILFLMVIAVAIVFIHRRREAGGTKLPREPFSIPIVMGYLYGSRMLADFEGLSGLSTHARNKHIQDLGRRYGLGHGVSVVDRRTVRLGIDEEPLLVGQVEVEVKESGEKW